MKFPREVPLEDVDIRVKEWKISGYEVTLYQNTNPAAVRQDEIFMFVQEPVTDDSAIARAIYIACESGYRVYESDTATLPGAQVSRFMNFEHDSPYFEVAI